MHRRSTIGLAAVLSTCLAGAGLAKDDDEVKQVRKVARAAAKRTMQWFNARNRKRLFKKGSGFSTRKRNVRTKAVAAAFLGFAPRAYRKEHRDPIAWIDGLYRGGQPRPNWNRHPLAVARAAIKRVTVHRDAVTVDALVTYDVKKNRDRGLRVVWAHPKKQLLLALRSAPARFDRTNLPALGPVPGKEVFKTGMAKSMLTANGFLAKAEGILAREPGREEAEQKLHALSVADFGEFVQTGTFPGKEAERFAEVRCGYMLARVGLTAREAKAAEGLQAGDRVLFTGKVNEIKRRHPWEVQEYERGGVKYRFKCIVVRLKGGVTKKKRPN